MYWGLAIVYYEAPSLATKASHSTSKLMMAFDLPFYPAGQIAVAKANIAAFDGFSEGEKQAIKFGTTHQLFPRVARANADERAHAQLHSLEILPWIP